MVRIVAMNTSRFYRRLKGFFPFHSRCAAKRLDFKLVDDHAQTLRAVQTSV